jgi:hypothetical protein
MAFILTKDKKPDGHEAYHQYLQKHKQKFPLELWQVITSDWYYDPTDHRCLHDSALESLNVTDSTHLKETSGSDISITLKLMGAYRDGYTTYTYRGVARYAVQMDIVKIKHKPPCDWLADEFLLTDSDLIRHEIEWETNYWLIEARSVSYDWRPLFAVNSTSQP